MATSNGRAIGIALADYQVKKNFIIFTLRAAAKNLRPLCLIGSLFFCRALNLIAKEPIVVIALVLSFLLNVRINSLLEQGDQIFNLCLLMSLPLLMLGLPLLVFQCMYRRTQSATKAAQQLLRATAGPDELLVRELSDRRNNSMNKINHGRAKTE